MIQESAWHEIFPQYYKADKLDSKIWNLIHVERYTGLFSMMTIGVYISTTLIVGGLALMYLYADNRPSIMQLFIAFENCAWYDKLQFYTYVALLVSFFSIRYEIFVLNFENVFKF